MHKFCIVTGPVADRSWIAKVSSTGMLFIFKVDTGEALIKPGGLVVILEKSRAINDGSDLINHNQ